MMFSLEVATLFLLFGALAHCQQPECTSECSQEESDEFHKHTINVSFAYVCDFLFASNREG